MEQHERPRQITVRHLRRLAIVYVRQSTERQVLENEGSTAFQRGQAHHAQRWGWPDDRILVFEDLGLSGRFSAHRPKYLEMIDLIGRNEVGIVLASDTSRLARNAAEQMAFLNLCKVQRTLLAIKGEVRDLSDASQMLLHGVVASVDDFENVKRQETFWSGREALLKDGKAVSRPPAGYVAVGKGAWELDPDPLVQAAIRTVFAEFFQCRSLVRTVRSLLKNGVNLPRRSRDGVRWVAPQVAHLQRILHNVAYRGDYLYGVRRSDPALGQTPNGTTRTRLADPEERTPIDKHHTPYISREEWDEIQRILRLNSTGTRRHNLGPGTALVQGIVRCATHDCAMQAQYKSHNQKLSSFHGYGCWAKYLKGGPTCVYVSGYHLDRAVRAAVLARLGPPDISSLRNEWKATKTHIADEHHRRELDLQRARRRVEDALRHARTVDESLRDAKAEANEIWNKELGNLRRLETAHRAPAPAAVDLFSEDLWDELLLLAQDVEAIWDASTTEHRDRKELVRTLVRTVMIDGRTREQVQARIVWADGTPDTQLDIKLAPYAHKLIADLMDSGASADQIADHLNREGLRTLLGNRWNRSAVKHIREWIRKHRRRAGTVEDRRRRKPSGVFDVVAADSDTNCLSEPPC